MKKVILCFVLILALLINTLSTVAESASGAPDLSDYFSRRDLSGTWDTSEAVQIDLNSQSNTVTIDKAGIYVLSGTLNGNVQVSAGETDKVQLVLNNADITSDTGAAIVIESADKVFVTLAEGSVNTLTAKAFAENESVDAALFSRQDMTINGSGSLTVVSANHGIVGKDDLKVTGGNISITAEGRGLDGNDSVRIYNGSFTIVSAKDAIRSKESEKEGKGYVLIAGGTFDLTIGGGTQNAEPHRDEMGRGGFGPSRGYSSSSSSSSDSTKGVKAAQQILIMGGTLNINSADDALHTDGDLIIYDGELNLHSGDDGIHADNALTINGGTVNVLESYEGLEATVLTINGGDISVTASDDGLNVAGGNDSSGFGWNDMFASDGVSLIAINGGSLYVNSAGDGIDSNGDLAMTGGTVVVSGPTNSMNGALDYNGTGTISGGTLIAAGAVGMAENFSSSSEQASTMVNLSGQPGEIVVKDAEGNILLSATVEKSFSCVVISSPDLTFGNRYTVSSGASTMEFTAGSGSTGGGFGSPGWQQPGGQGGRRGW